MYPKTIFTFRVDNILAPSNPPEGKKPCPTEHRKKKKSKKRSVKSSGPNEKMHIQLQHFNSLQMHIHGMPQSCTGDP